MEGEDPAKEPAQTPSSSTQKQDSGKVEGEQWPPSDTQGIPVEELWNMDEIFRDHKPEVKPACTAPFNLTKRKATKRLSHQEQAYNISKFARQEREEKAKMLRGKMSRDRNPRQSTGSHSFQGRPKDRACKGHREPSPTSYKLKYSVTWPLRSDAPHCGSRELHQSSVVDYFRPRDKPTARKSVFKKTRLLEQQTAPIVSGLCVGSAPQKATTSRPNSLSVKLPPLEDNFVFPIKLEPIEESFLVRCKYMFEAATKKLVDMPPFPMGLQTFQSSMLEVQMDAVSSRATHQTLLQALYAGQAAAGILMGMTLKQPSQAPEWAKLPDPMPGSLLKSLSLNLSSRNFLIYVPGASWEHLMHIIDKLTSYGISTSYVPGRYPWVEGGPAGTYLATTETYVDGDPQNFFDGIIVPKGAPKSCKVPCGHLNIELHPEIANLIPRRTAFVDCRLNELIKRLKQSEALGVKSKRLSEYGVDVCSGELGIIFSHQETITPSNVEVATLLIRRCLRAAKLFRHLVIVRLIANASTDFLRDILQSVEAKFIHTDCNLQVIEAGGVPIGDTIKCLCEDKGDDLSDFAFFTVEDSLQVGIPDEGTPNQSPHASLTATLL